MNSGSLGLFLKGFIDNNTHLFGYNTAAPFGLTMRKKGAAITTSWV